MRHKTYNLQILSKHLMETRDVTKIFFQKSHEIHNQRMLSIGFVVMDPVTDFDPRVVKMHVSS